jgi:hypothetical protein
VRLACAVALWWSVACRNTETPHDGVFTGDFLLARESDWPGGQACDYVIPMDETVCNWGRLSVTVDSIAASVFGSDVHLGGPSGPLLRRDSVLYAVRVGVGNACTVFIAGNAVKPNGPGVLAADTLQFAGRSLLGDSVRWVYAPVQVQRASRCG